MASEEPTAHHERDYPLSPRFVTRSRQGFVRPFRRRPAVVDGGVLLLRGIEKRLGLAARLTPAARQRSRAAPSGAPARGTSRRRGRHDRRVAGVVDRAGAQLAAFARLRTDPRPAEQFAIPQDRIQAGVIRALGPEHGDAVEADASSGELVAASTSNALPAPVLREVAPHTPCCHDRAAFSPKARAASAGRPRTVLAGRPGPSRRCRPRCGTRCSCAPSTATILSRSSWVSPRPSLDLRGGTNGLQVPQHHLADRRPCHARARREM